MWNIILAFLLTVSGFALGGALMLLCTRIAKVEKRSFPKAVLASAACVFTKMLIAGGFFSAGGTGLLVGIFINIWLQIAIIKTIFSTETGKAVITLVLDYIVSAISAIIVITVFFSYFHPLFKEMIK